MIESVAPLRIGMIGAGKISGHYLRTFPRLPGLALVAVADLDSARAQAAVAGHPDARPVSVDELLAADDVDAVLDLTIPAAHAQVALAALAAGKHVYGEKPLAADRGQAARVLSLAKHAGLRIGCAPDTVLGHGLQTARKLVEDGMIGVPAAATAFMTCPGHEGWHPDPEFYYRPGGGPLFDMGPYYLTALVHLLGPVTSVVGFSSRPTRERVIGSGPRAGTRFGVEVDTHVTGVLKHAGGALTTLVMSFEVWAAHLPRIEVYGTDSALSVPDPNLFEGDVALFPAGGKEWARVPPSAGYADAARGYGLADMARALALGQPHRASGEMAAHVLDVMQSLLEASADATAMTVRSTCQLPTLVPLNASPYRLDE